MQEAIRAGIPTRPEYVALLNQAEFKSLESYAERFRSAHAPLFRQYGRRWVSDPLHQWSRQWEYPFMFSALSKHVGTERPLRILDAGAGLTFFPFFLLDRFPELEVECCDLDRSLSAKYARIASERPRSPQFRVADLTALPYGNETLDAIYCVSVLEHIPERQRVVRELARVLKAGGKLILSVDIAIDGAHDISIPDARHMTEQLDVYFHDSGTLGVPAGGILDRATVFSTHDALEIDPRLLPWAYPALVHQLASFYRRRDWPQWPPLLTVACGTLTKRA